MRARGIGETALSLRVIDVISHSLGVAGVDQATHRLCNKILIPRNTPLPVRVTYKFVTKETDQQSVAIKVLEGESLDVAGCSLLGKAVLRDLPPDLPKGHPIEVIFHCQQNGRLQVTAKVTDTDHAITVQFERERMMPRADLRRWQDAVADGSAFEDLGPLLDKLNTGQAG
jgi:molecular chaperone DnaK